MAILPSRGARKIGRTRLGILPFLAFCLAFEILPVLLLLFGSFDKSGTFTLANYEKITTPIFGRSFWNSIHPTAIKACLGAVLGLKLTLFKSLLVLWFDSGVLLLSASIDDLVGHSSIHRLEARVGRVRAKPRSEPSQILAPLTAVSRPHSL